MAIRCLARRERESGSPVIKVLHIITGLQTGGAEGMLYKLLSRVDRERFGSEVLSLGNGGVFGPRLQALGIRVHCLDMKPSRPTLGAGLRLRGLVRAIAPDVVQGWMYHGNLAASLCRFLAGGRERPVLWNVRHSLYDSGAEKPLTRLTIRASAPLSSGTAGVIYNSEVSAAQHAAAGFSTAKTRVIPNGFDCDLFAPRPDAPAALCGELGLPAGTVLIGGVGRYHPMKDHANFLRAAACLSATHPGVHFVLVGTGMHWGNGELLALVKRLGLEERVHLLGERQDIPALTAGLTLATSSSAWGDAFSNAVGEAMACAVPCVVTDVGDAGRIVADTGVVVAPRDPAGLAAGWRELLASGNPGLRERGRRARQRVLDRFSLATVVRQYETLYERVGHR